jgi:Cu/Ag efflux protein CusF
MTVAGIDEFQAQEPIMLNALRPGDKVTFTADRVNGQPTIVTIVPPK